MICIDCNQIIITLPIIEITETTETIITTIISITMFEALTTTIIIITIYTTTTMKIRKLIIVRVILAEHNEVDRIHPNIANCVGAGNYLNKSCKYRNKSKKIMECLKR